MKVVAVSATSTQANGTTRELTRTVNSTQTTQKRKRSASLSSISAISQEDTPSVVQTSKPIPAKEKSKGRKKKETEEPKVEDYPIRKTNEWKVGAHVSSAGGVENAILNAADVG